MRVNIEMLKTFLNRIYYVLMIEVNETFFLIQHVFA